MAAPEVSLNEWVVLALLAEGPSHGFALAKNLEAGTDLGRVLTVRRPLVYRALGRLVDARLAEPHHSEPGVAGPNRTVHRLTRSGRTAVRAWLRRPVEHVRELRIEFLVKLRLARRAGSDTTELVAAQREALADTLARLAALDDDADEVDLWRHHNAVAVQAFLDHIAG
ncbi:MAG: helix-turn-helix transcriptional regulator [Acidimicrobiales bacterium]